MSNRSRGAAAEREFAALIGGAKISRTGYAGPDVEGPDGKLYEVKRIKVLPRLLQRWLQQMSDEGAAAVVFRANRGRWIRMEYVDENTN
jgi:hypothetical protein